MNFQKMRDQWNGWGRMERLAAVQNGFVDRLFDALEKCDDKPYELDPLPVAAEVFVTHQTVPEIKQYVAGTYDVETLKAMLEAEDAGASRKGVLTVIRKRLKELEDAEGS